jgi:hypothetical protein
MQKMQIRFLVITLSFCLLTSGPLRVLSQDISTLPREIIRYAESHHAEDKIDTLEVGKFADFALIDKDYLSGPDTEVRKIRC